MHIRKFYWMKSLSQIKACLRLRLQGTRAQVFILIGVSVFSSLALYFPFRHNMDIIYRYFDGPLYMCVARTWYEVPQGTGMPAGYISLTMPLYPVIVKIISLLFPYPLAMIISTVLCSTGATICFYFLLREMKCVHSPFYSAGISLFLPVKWIIYHSVGASEPLFLFLVFLSLYLFRKQKYFWSFLTGIFISATRVVGVLITLVYFIMLVRKKKYKWIPALSMIPIGIVAAFLFYRFKFGDFFIYFKSNAGMMTGDVAATFRAYAGDPHFGELFFLLTVLYGIGLLLLWKYPLLFSYSAVFYTFNLFVNCEDISRFFIVVTPFVLIVAYDRILNTRQFKTALIGIIIMVYIYAWNVIPGNLCKLEHYRIILGE